MTEPEIRATDVVKILRAAKLAEGISVQNHTDHNVIVTIENEKLRARVTKALERGLKSTFYKDENGETSRYIIQDLGGGKLRVIKAIEQGVSWSG